MQHPLAVYVPMDRLQALARSDELPDRANGSVLFADVFGFTALTAAVTQELGPQRGAEQLTSQLNRVYGMLVDEVHRYRGSVINFAGDAVTCWFGGDPGVRATTCALAMQAAMAQLAELTTSQGAAITFGVKISVMSGAARRFLVGDPQIQVMDVLAGSLLDRMGVAQQQLCRGEIAVGPEVLERLGTWVREEDWRITPQGKRFILINALSNPAPADPWPALPPLDSNQVRPWLLPVLGQRLEQGEAQLLAELRPAIPCFLQFSGIDYDHDPEAGSKLDAFTRWVQVVLTHYGGYLAQLMMGDKGSCMSILFGAPVSHEDDVTRAVAAAMELQTLPTDLDFIRDIRMGISQGQTYIGVYGGEARRTYGGIGREVNLASRLMSWAAPGQIVVSDRVVSAAAGYAFESLGEAELKGIPNPVPVFEVVGRRRSIGHSPHQRPVLPMVGRETERAFLSEQLRGLISGQSGSCFVEGEAGIGKSRLIDDLVEQAQQVGIATLVGVGDAMEAVTPYYAWRKIFRDLLGLEEADSKEGRDEALQRLLEVAGGDDYLRERLPLLNSVLPLNLADNPLTAQMSGELRAANTRSALIHLLLWMQQETPLLVVLEDAHWLDSASWALAAAVRQAVQPILLGVVMRPLVDSVPGECEALREAEGTCCLRLEALSPADVTTLVCRRLGARELAPEVAMLIQEKAEGHPFFSEELACALRDAGDLEVDDRGVARLTSIEKVGNALAFPDTIQGVITSRIDRLPLTQQLVLKMASVIGRTFSFQILWDIYPIEADRNTLIDSLKQLEALDILQIQSSPPDLKYLFKHTMIQEVAYGLMLYAQRRELHERIAVWYEQALAGDLSAFYPLLAYHWTRAENPGRALDYLEKAGDQALQNYANEEALTLFQQALELAEKAGAAVNPERRARWELALGEACVNQSRHAEGRRHFEAGLAMLGNPVPVGRVMPAVRLAGQLIRQALHRLWPQRYVGRYARRKELFQAISRACEKLAEVYVLQSYDMILTAYVVFSGLNAAELAGPCSELARSYVSIGGMMGVIPLHQLARAYIQQALEVARKVNTLSARGYAAFYAGYYYTGVGNWPKAEGHLKSALESLGRLGDRRLQESALWHLCRAARYRGNFGDGLKFAEEGYRSAFQRNDVYQQINFLTDQICCLLPQGAALLDQVTDRLAVMNTLLAEHPETAETTRLEVCETELAVYLRQGDYPAVLRTAAVLEAALGNTQILLYDSLFVCDRLAEAYLTVWESGYVYPELEKLAEKACRRMEKYAQVFAIGYPYVWLRWGQYQWLSGCRRAALRMWQRSLTTAKQLGVLYGQGLAHYEIGRRLVGRPERREHLHRAFEIFNLLNALALLERVQAALE